MGCFVPFLAVLMPRTVIIFIALLTNWFSQAYETTIWPVLGFFFMPYTTLAYMAAMIQNNHQVSGPWMVLMFIAVFFDLAGQFGSVNRSPRYE